MAATVTVKARRKVMNGYAIIADVKMDSSYPENGESLSAKQFGLAVIDFALPSPAGGYIFEFDHTNSKLKAFYPVGNHTHKFTTGSTTAADATSGALAEDANGDETVVRLMGAAVDTDYEVVLAGTGTNVAGTEVAASTDLSSVTVRMVVFGY